MREIHLVDRGRGLQLSSSRVTVQDLVPYLQEGCPYEEIRRWIPTLTDEEIAVIERYYRAHQEALDADESRIRQRNAERKDEPKTEQLRAEGKARMQALREHLRRTGASGEAT